MTGMEIYQKDLGHTLLTDDDETVATKSDLVRHNLRFAYRIAMKYTGLGVPAEDLVQAANLGLIRAAETYDPSVGRFITYAVLWVRQRIITEIQNTAHIVRLPATAYRDRHKIYQYETDGIPEDQWADLLGVTDRRVETAMRAYVPYVSLDKPLDADMDDKNKRTPLALVLSDADPHADVEQAEMAQAAREMLARLDTRRRDMVMRRYGLHPYPEAQTLEDIGDAWGLSKERARQLVGQALEKMRKNVRNRHMGELVA